MESDSVGKTPRYLRYFSCGALFEVLLVAGSIGLSDCNLGIHLRNFTTIVHLPVMAILMAFGESPVGIALGLILAFVLMASLWGFLLFQSVRLAKWLWSRLGRKQKMATIVVMVFVGIFLLIQVLWEGLPQKPTPFEASSSVQSAVAGNNAFAVDLYHQLQEQPGNLFFSPFSISSALAMTSAGARGQTEAEMTNALQLNLPPQELHRAFKSLTARMNHIQRWNRIVLKCANSLWCQKDYHFQPTYLQLIRENYFAEAAPVDFENPNAAGQINRWISQATNHKIPAGLSPGQLSADTRLALCNAVYFKGTWQHQFKLRDTKPGEFHITTNETITVPMMCQKAHFKRTRTDDGVAELLEMPYVGNDLSMVVLLPSEYPTETGEPQLTELEKDLTADNLRKWLGALDCATPNDVWVSLPRFTTQQSFDLAKELKALGMVSAFNGSADFSGMDGTTNLFLSNVFHKTFVDVNESGTEAAAVSVSLVKTKGMSGSFLVNRPFLFLIRENGSGSILFLGRIMDPTK